MPDGTIHHAIWRRDRVQVILIFWLVSALIFDRFSSYHSSRQKKRLMQTAKRYSDANKPHLVDHFEQLAADTSPSWGYWESIYYTAITFTTIGLGDFSVGWYGLMGVLEVVTFVVVTCCGIVLFIELTCAHARHTFCTRKAHVQHVSCTCPARIQHAPSKRCGAADAHVTAPWSTPTAGTTCKF